MLPPPSNRRKTGRFGRGGRRRDVREQPKVELSNGPLAGLTSQAPSQLSAAGSSSKPAPPAAPRPRPGTQRHAIQQPTTRRKVIPSATGPNPETQSGTVDRADSQRILTTAAPKDNTRQMMILGGLGGGMLLLLILVFAVGSSSPTPRRREPERPYQPPKSYSAPRPSPPPRRAPVNFHRLTGSIMFICSNSDLHPDKEVVIRQCPACGATAPFTWDKDADQYDCKRCKGVVGSAQIQCSECGRKPRVTRLKHGK